MDKVVFSGKEILSIALRLELNGEAFYREASKTVEQKELHDLFIYLAMEEKRHYQHFKKISNLTNNDQETSLFESPDTDELSLYLSALSGLKLFTDPQAGAKLGRNVKDDSAALEVAIGLENDAIIFFQELLNNVSDDDKMLVKNLLAEEEDHKRRLSDFRKS